MDRLPFASEKCWVNEDVLDRMQDRLDRMPEAMGVRRQTVEHKGLDGRHPLPDQDARQGPNRDEPPRPGLQHEANDHDLRRGTPDDGDQNLIASLKPHAPIDQRASRPSRQGSTPRRPRRMTRFSTASVPTPAVGYRSREWPESAPLTH